MLSKVLNIVTIVLLAGALGVCLVVGGCDMPVPTLTGGVPMKCVGGLSAVSVVMGAGLVLALAQLFLKTAEAKRFAALSLGVITLVAALILSPLVVGTCSWDGNALCCGHLLEQGATVEELAWCGLTMDCHISALVVWIVAALIIIIQIIVALKARAGTSEAHKPKLFD